MCVPFLCLCNCYPSSVSQVFVPQVPEEAICCDDVNVAIGLFHCHLSSAEQRSLQARNNQDIIHSKQCYSWENREAVFFFFKGAPCWDNSTPSLQRFNFQPGLYSNMSFTIWRLLTWGLRATQFSTKTCKIWYVNCLFDTSPLSFTHAVIFSVTAVKCNFQLQTCKLFLTQRKRAKSQ